MRVSIASSWLRRMKGLVGIDYDKADGLVLMLVPCHCVHTFTMALPIDVAFVDCAGRVCKTYVNLPPRRYIACRGACATLERFSPVGNTSVAGEIPPHASLFVDDGWFHVGDYLDLNTTESSLIAEIENAWHGEWELEETIEFEHERTKETMR